MSYQLKELSIELTYRCIMNCIMCSSGALPVAQKGELTCHEVLRLISEGAELGASVLSLSGGDPILLDELLDVYIQAAGGCGYKRVLLYTSGVAALGPMPIKTDTLDILSAYRDNLSVILSLHSHNPVVHDYIMGTSGAWKTTIASIRSLLNRKIDVQVHCVPMLPNWKDIKSLWNLCDAIGVSKISFLRFVPQTRGRYNNRMLALTLGEFRELMVSLHLLVTEYWKSKHTDVRLGCPIDFRHSCIIGENGDFVFDKKQHPCHAGTDLMLVRPLGDVHPCAAWKTLPDTDNVRKASLKDIWENSVILNKIRAFRDGGYLGMQSECAGCAFLVSCKTGCLAQRIHHVPIIYGGEKVVNIDDGLYSPWGDPMCPLV